MKNTQFAFGSNHSQGTKKHQPARLAVLAVLLLVTVGSLVNLSAAADTKVQPPVLLSSLKGKWAAAIVGNTGCGLGTMYVTFTLDAFGHGNGTATIVGHGQCGDSTTSGLNFNIGSLNANGSGTAGLSCGTGCGWVLNIQVARNSQVFNLVDVSPTDPNNYIAGTAIHQ
jgi:hypothetical protein